MVLAGDIRWLNIPRGIHCQLSQAVISKTSEGEHVSWLMETSILLHLICFSAYFCSDSVQSVVGRPAVLLRIHVKRLHPSLLLPNIVISVNARIYQSGNDVWCFLDIPFLMFVICSFSMRAEESFICSSEQNFFSQVFKWVPGGDFPMQRS